MTKAPGSVAVFRGVCRGPNRKRSWVCHTGLLDGVGVPFTRFPDILVTFFKASVSKTLNSTNQSAATPCALHAAHTARLERLALLPRSCDVSDVPGSLPQILAAPRRSPPPVCRFPTTGTAPACVLNGRRRSLRKKKQEQQLTERVEGDGM